jgi:hypothetical protein
MIFTLFRVSLPHSLPRHPCHHEHRVDEAFFFIRRTSVAKLVSNIRQRPPQKSYRGTKLESADVPFCSWDGFAAACAIVHLC